MRRPSRPGWADLRSEAVPGSRLTGGRTRRLGPDWLLGRARRGRPTSIEHYYHVYAVNRWREILSQHLDELERSGLLGELDRVHLGIVGPDHARAEVVSMASERVGVEVVAEAENGWEHLTLRALWRAPKRPGVAVLYAHSKGASYSRADPFRDAWRKSMTTAVVVRWRRCLRLLRDHDLVGCHWLTPERWGAVPDFGECPYFGGNFWWARSEWLATLGPPLPGPKERWAAEPWVGGCGNPRVADLTPGWPGLDTFLP